MTTPAPVTIYAKDNCVQCDTTKRHLDRNGVPYTIEDATAPDNLAAIQSLGFSSAPVVAYGDHIFSGFNPVELNRIIADYAPLKASEA